MDVECWELTALERVRVWPTLREIWDGLAYALAVAALFGVIGLLIAIPE